jgi:hypothetical protein
MLMTLTEAFKTALTTLDEGGCFAYLDKQKNNSVKIHVVVACRKVRVWETIYDC